MFLSLFVSLSLSLTVSGLSLNSNWPAQDSNGNDFEFDYIIVGGGPAGLTIADRLTENSGVTVLLVEAGPPDRNEDSITVPFYQGSAAMVDGACGNYCWCDVC